LAAIRLSGINLCGGKTNNHPKLRYLDFCGLNQYWSFPHDGISYFA
jgi:hypothetical protein